MVSGRWLKEAESLFLPLESRLNQKDKSEVEIMLRNF